MNLNIKSLFQKFPLKEDYQLYSSQCFYWVSCVSSERSHTLEFHNETALLMLVKITLSCSNLSGMSEVILTLND